MKCWLVALLVVVSSLAEAAGDRLEAGRAVYNYRCYFCHGYSGDAKTLAASFLDPRPTAFVAVDPGRLNEGLVLETLRPGRSGTAMKSFSGILDDQGMTAVAAFVVDKFVRRKAANTRYHAAENGWPDHERYRPAFPLPGAKSPFPAPGKPSRRRNREQLPLSGQLRHLPRPGRPPDQRHRVGCPSAFLPPQPLLPRGTTGQRHGQRQPLRAARQGSRARPAQRGEKGAASDSSRPTAPSAMAQTARAGTGSASFSNLTRAT